MIGELVERLALLLKILGVHRSLALGGGGTGPRSRSRLLVARRTHRRLKP